MNFSDALWDTNISGMFISGVDGTLLKTNAAFLKMFGFSKHEDVKNKSFATIFEKNADYLEVVGRLLGGKSLSGYIFKATDSNKNSLQCELNAGIFEEGEESKILGSLQNITELNDARQNLLDIEKTYQNLFEHSTEIIQSFDSTGKLYFCNRTWYNKLEYTESDLRNITLFDIIAPELHEHCKVLMSEVFSGKSISDISVTFYTKSGKKLLLQGTVVPYIQRGKVLATHGFFRDITDQVDAINLAKEKEILVSTIFDSLPICLYVKDEEGKYVLTNSYMDNTLSVAPIGRSDSSVFPPGVCKILNDTDKLALSQNNQIVNYNLHIKEGATDEYYLCGKKAIALDQSTNKLFGYSINVTEIMKAKHMLEINQHMLEFVMNHANEALLLYKKGDDNKFNLVFKNNRADYFFNETDSYRNLDSFTTFLGIDKADFGNLQKGETFSHEKEIFINENPVCFHIKLAPFLRFEEEDYVLLSLYDITENKSLLEEVEKKYNENLVLIGEVYHRVKNNLAIIDGIFELKKSQITEPEVRQLISDMQLRVKSIALVHQKLYDATDLSTIPFDEYIKEMTSYYRHLYVAGSSNNVVFDFNVQSGITLEINKAIPLGLLLSELISNSLKYGIKDGKVVIYLSLAKKDNSFLLSFRDSGSGIPPGSAEGQTPGFGLKLLKSLEKQLKGTASYPDPGSFAYELIFPAS